MKNILSKLGSKKVMGAVLVMVTLAVGIGVIGNFSGDAQKRADEAALSKLGENSYNTFPGGGVSRSDLEKQLSSGQDTNTARFFRTAPDGSIEEDDTFNEEFAVGEGFVYGEGSNYGQGAQGGAAGSESNVRGGQYAQGDNSNVEIIGGASAGQGGVRYTQGGQGVQSGEGAQSDVRNAQDKSGQMYAKGGVSAKSGNGESGKNTAFTVKGKKSINTFSNNSGSADATTAEGGAVGAGSAESKAAAAKAAKEAAAKAEKAKKEKEERNRARRETQINRLASAGGGSSSFSSSGGSSSGGSSLGGAIQGDTSSRPVLGANSAQTMDSNSSGFKAGRGGNMGGFNVARAGYANGGEGASPKGGGGDRSAINQMAYSFSASKNAARLTSEGSKEAARDAFEQNGENGTGALIEDGASIQRAVSQLPDSGTVGDTPSSSLLGAGSGIEAKEKQLEDLQDDVEDLYTNLLLGAAGMILGIHILATLSKAAFVPWLQVALFVAACILAAACVLFIFGKLRGFGAEPNEDSLLGKIAAIESDELAPVNEDVGGGYKPWLAWLVSGVLSGLAVAALFVGTSGGFLTNWIAGLGGGNGVMAGILGLVGLGGAAAEVVDTVKTEKDDKEEEQK